MDFIRKAIFNLSPFFLFFQEAWAVFESNHFQGYCLRSREKRGKKRREVEIVVAATAGECAYEWRYNKGNGKATRGIRVSAFRDRQGCGGAGEFG
jgi:hypothetical protein